MKNITVYSFEVCKKLVIHNFKIFFLHEKNIIISKFPIFQVPSVSQLIKKQSFKTFKVYFIVQFLTLVIFEIFTPKNWFSQNEEYCMYIENSRR